MWYLTLESDHHVERDLPDQRLQKRGLSHDGDGTKITRNEYIDRWADAAVKRRVREKAWQNYEGMLRRYPLASLGERASQEIDREPHTDRYSECTDQVNRYADRLVFFST